jgi:hypothetical protein
MYVKTLMMTCGGASCDGILARLRCHPVSRWLWELAFSSPFLFLVIGLGLLWTIFNKVPELINQSILSFFDFFGHDVFNCDVHILELIWGRVGSFIILNIISSSSSSLSSSSSSLQLELDATFLLFFFIIFLSSPHVRVMHCLLDEEASWLIFLASQMLQSSQLQGGVMVHKSLILRRAVAMEAYLSWVSTDTIFLTTSAPLALANLLHRTHWW